MKRSKEYLEAKRIYMAQWRKKNEERLKRIEEERKEQDRIIEEESLEKLKIIYNKLMKEYYL